MSLVNGAEGGQGMSWGDAGSVASREDVLDLQYEYRKELADEAEKAADAQARTDIYEQMQSNFDKNKKDKGSGKYQGNLVRGAGGSRVLSADFK